jgi:hypothetical protein
LDSESGAAVRLAGHFVKSPSIFVKRVSVVRETTLQDGVPATRLTHLSLDMRFIGLAEVTIKESPRSALDDAATPNRGW